MEVTRRDIDLFKAGWEAANAEQEMFGPGIPGDRTRAGLEAVFQDREER